MFRQILAEENIAKPSLTVGESFPWVIAKSTLNERPNQRLPSGPAHAIYPRRHGPPRFSLRLLEPKNAAIILFPSLANSTSRPPVNRLALSLEDPIFATR